jgi:hypothetical protein
MFVVKHYRNDGTILVATCDSYEVDTTRSPHRITTYARPAGPVHLDPVQGEAVFVENLLGKTITAIRLRD